jgi:hypothetical protein
MVLLAVLATARASFAEPTPAGGATTLESSEAKAQFANAQKLFKADRFAEALPLFVQLDEATQSPNARLYAAYCLQRLGRNVDAYAAFTAVVKEIDEHPEPRYAQVKEAAVAQLAVLNAHLAKIVVSPNDVPFAASVTIDGKTVDHKDLGTSIVVEPGKHRVDLFGTGVLPTGRDVSVDGGELKTVTFSSKQAAEALAASEPVNQPSAPSASDDHSSSDGGQTMRTVGLVAGATGVAGIAVFAVTGLMLKSKVQDLEAQCPNGCTDADHLGQVDRARALQTTANVGLVVGLVGIGVGTTLFVLGQSKRSDNSVSASLGNGGAIVSYAGRF